MSRERPWLKQKDRVKTPEEIEADRKHDRFEIVFGIIFWIAMLLFGVWCHSRHQ